MEKVENKEICRTCGFCCKKCGCDYFVQDIIPFNLKNVEEMLQTTKVSIIATLDFSRVNNIRTVNPILSLRARNINRGEIDLLSFKTTCASLTENGCTYDLETRPSGGGALIPQKDRMCRSSADKIEELEKYLPYQNLLARIVKRHTGKSVYAKLSEDVEELFYKLFTEDFEGVMPEEEEEIKSMVPMLAECFPNELLKAEERYNHTYPTRVLAPKKNKKRTN